jgi:hypothetical protein
MVTVVPGIFLLVPLSGVQLLVLAAYAAAGLGVMLGVRVFLQRRKQHKATKSAAKAA